MRRILALARAEVLHVTRDRATLAQIFIMPIVQLLVLSNAATFEIRDTSAYVVDQDRSAMSSGLVERFAASGHFRVIERGGIAEPGEPCFAQRRGHRGPDDSGRFRGVARAHGGGPVADVSSTPRRDRLPASCSPTPCASWSYYSRELAAERPSHRTPGTAPRIDVQVRHWYNQTLNYKHYMVPGILVSLVTMIATLLSAQNIAREKELGTLEQLNVTPITRGQFITAKLLPFWGLAMIDFAIGLMVGWLFFDIPVRGSLPLLFAVAAIYLMVVLAIGLWISTLVDTQQQAMFVTFFVMMIYLLMSGLFTPVDSMPPWVQVVSEFTPVRHFVAISRAILVKGAGLAEIARPLAILAGYAAVMWLVAIRQYSKRSA